MATLSYLTTTHFDFGAVQRIPMEIARAGISKPLITTDRGVRSVGLVDTITGTLGGDVPISIFDETPGNPTESAVLKAFDQYNLISALHNFHSLKDENYKNMLPPLTLLNDKKLKELVKKLNELKFTLEKNLAA